MSQKKYHTIFKVGSPVCLQNDATTRYVVSATTKVGTVNKVPSKMAYPLCIGEKSAVHLLLDNSKLALSINALISSATSKLEIFAYNSKQDISNYFINRK